MKRSLICFWFLGVFVLCSGLPGYAGPGDDGGTLPVSVPVDQVPDDVEFQALKAIYDSLGGPNWTNKANWPAPGNWPATATAAQMDTWYGVGVTNGDITLLNLQANNLAGKIPAAISQLSALTTIIFSINTITALPASLCSLPNLSKLYLNSNLITGTFPGCLNNVTSLQDLNLGSNKFTGAFPDLSGLTNLTQFTLSANTFTEGPVPQWIGNLTNLQTLDLEGTFRNGAIPETFVNLASLIRLRLQNNKISGVIPIYFGNFSQLSELVLHNNQLTGAIPSDIGNLTNLTTLNLQNNQLSGNIPESLGNLVNLLYLHLSVNQLTGPIPPSLGNLSKVIWLVMGDNDLTGNIPPELGNLTNLTLLHLHGNTLTGSIPASFGNLTKITNLFLHKNQLTGGIPSELSSLVNMIELNVYENQLSGNLPPSLGNLTKLKQFRAYTNQLTGPIPASFSNLTELSVLSLATNQLSGTLPDMFSSLTKLATLSLSTNQFTGAIPASIGNCAQIIDISAADNKFTSLPASLLSLPALTIVNFHNNDLASIPDLSSQVNKANLSLLLQNNRLDFSQLEPLVNGGFKFVTTPLVQHSISDFSSVALSPTNVLTINARPKGQFSTVIWERQLTDGTWENVTVLNEDATGQTFKLTSGLSQVGKSYRWKMTNTKVTGVTLTSAPILVRVTEGLVPDDIEFQALKAIYDSLGGANWTNKANWPAPGNWPATATAAEMDTWYAVTVTDGDITAITLNQNNLSGIIPRTITNLTKLKNLSLQSNQITGTIPPAIGNLTDLDILYLSVNNMSGPVPAGIGNLTNLATLSIYSNSFSGAIPASLNNLTHLTTLLLGTNQFSGSLPDLSALTQLTSFGMEGCPQLSSGPIPSWLQNCTELTSINVSAANRTGSIPGFIGSLSKLTYFNAGVNQLSGSIPSSLGNLSLLTHFYLNSNQLTGAIPQELGSLTNLLYLNLGSNQLTGSIPASLGNLTKLRELLINDNLITGPIPATFGNLPNLVFLYLYNNQLSGPIPSELGNLSSLQRLYINNNQLSGTLPPSLGNLSQLRNLWVYENQLTGTVPETFSGLLELSQLSISKNQFAGPLPDIFSSLTKLSTLSLSTNAFSGAFPSVSNCAMLTAINALNNNFTSLPASLLTLPVITQFNFNGNDLVTIPDFTTQVNKANLSLYLQNNRLDFSQLEPLINSGILLVATPLTQDNISDFSTVPLNSSYELTISARPKGQFSTVTWERQRVNGSWENVTALNEDATGQTFKMTSGLSQVGKVYRWRMTNTLVTGVTLNSSNITVTIGEGAVPDNLEFGALKALYDSLGGTNWTTKTNWPTPGNWPATATSAQMAAWYGITVTNGDVTGVAMVNNNLVGKLPAAISQLSKLSTLSLITNKINAIPSSLCSLSNLSTLFLSANQIEGTIPGCLNGITTLQYLNLGGNKFTGEIPDLRALTNLKQLNLSSNTFTEGPIPSWIGSITGLETLDMGGTVRNGTIPETFANLTSLKQFMLQSNKISGTIPSFIANFSQLTHLYLHGNQLTGSIPSSLGNLTHLQTLFLQFNQLSGNIPETLGNLSDLVYLHLGTNQLTGPIPASLNNLTKMNWLVLSGNQLGGDIPNLGALTNLLQLSLSVNAFNAGPIPSWISSLTKLQILELAQINRNGALPEMLGTLTSLKELRLNNNQLTGSVPANFSQLTELFICNISSNQLSGTIPEIFTSLTKLSSLALSINNFEGPFPTSIGNCAALTALYCDTNKFTSVPPSVLNLPLLNYISFDGNEVISIPNFANHTNKAALRLYIKNNRLDFSQLEPLINEGINQVVYTPQKTINDFSSVPLTASNALVINARPKGQFSTVTWERQLANNTWENVTSLNEDATGQTFKLTNGSSQVGKIYRWSMTNTKVTAVTLTSEPITVRVTEGLVPDAVEFAALKALYDSLGGPNWTTKTNWPTPGNWPATATVAEMDTWFGIAVSNADIYEITMPTNNLTGTLPAAVGNLTALTRLLLQDNKIAGQIPATIGNLQALKFLYFQTNQLTGIPSSLSTISSLEFLSLGRNKLTGDMPNLGALTNLKLLFLNDNTFNEGPIPGWLSGMTLMGQLDLSSTKRTGPIPSFITNFQNLTSLSLNSNQLTGEIPSTISQLSLLTALYLNSNQLTGGIPASLGNLSQLTHLYLSSNQLTGGIPAELGNLSKLFYLTLGTNQLTGTIPASLGNLTKLQGLYVNNNFLTGSIPASFGNLAELSYLQVQRNQLTGSIPSELGNLHKLIELYVNQNNLSGELPPSLGTISTLKVLYAHANQLIGNIPSSFSNLTNLTTLYLSTNQLSGVIPEIFGAMTKLTSLDLTANNFTGAFPTSIGNCVLLSYFRGDVNKFSSIPASVLTLPALTSINFEGSELNSIPDLSTHVNKTNLAVLMKNNRLDFSQLEPLINAGLSLLTYAPQKSINDISTVALNPVNVLTIPARPKGQFSTVTWERQLTNGTWENVTSLNEDATGQTFKLTNGLPQVGKTYRWKMTNTKVTGFTLTSDPILVRATEGLVPDNIEFAALKQFYDSLNGPNWTTKTNWPTPGNWPATATAAQMGTWYGVVVTNGDITQISYVGNNISGKLPASIGNLSSLKVIQINGSSLKGPLPATLNQLTSLRYLMFGSQPLLTGAIPDLSALTMLELFSLGSCPNLTPGPIPEWLGTFPLLTSINLIGTRRTGSIPANLGSLSNLTEFLLQSNQLSGSIPASLGGLTNVTTVNLGGNQLSGSIPSSLGNLAKLVSLYLNNNQLSGTIPVEIGNLGSLQYLHLSYNTLSGPIPSSIVSLSSLKELGLYSNQLSGTIPTNLDVLTNLTLLNLGNNQLSGTIPTSVCSLTKLVSLYVEINQLTGEIPTNIGNLTKLQYLSARSNQLTGTIPGSITNLTALKVLNLGSNQLSGGIPENIGNLTQLTQLYLDVNQLTGPVPSSIGNPTGLGYLYLASNQLSGPLPPSLGALTGMLYFNFSNNQFSGEIPASFSNFSNMRLFWIGNNAFSGPLPSNLFSTWTQVTSLFVNNNNFSGTFPEVGSCAALVDLRAYANKFTALPASMLNLPVATTINFDNNELISIPNFSNHVNKTNLGLFLLLNRLDLGSLETLFSGPGTSPLRGVTYSSQKPFNEVTALVIPRSHPLIIQARNPGTHGSITWEYRANASAAWTNINAQNEDATQRTLRISNFTSSRNGLYRYTMTNTWVTGATLQSVEMNITAGDYPVEWVRLKNVTVTAGALSKTAADGWNKSGADASNTLPPLTDGWIEFVTTATGGNYIIGLATSDKLEQGSMLHGIQINNSDVFTGESETFIAAGTQQPGDVFRISREGAQVRYFKNGTEIRAITADPKLTLRVKALIYSGTSPKVLASFDVKPVLDPLFTSVNPIGTGGITVTTAHGKEPYNYTWSDGTNGPAISGKPVGIYTATSHDAVGRIVSAPYDLGYAVNWTDRLNADVLNGRLVKTAPEGWGNAGANSVNILKGQEDGWLSFVADTTAGAYMIGFATDDNHFGDQSVAQGFYIDGNNLLYLVEAGAAPALVGSKVPGDVFRVLRAGSQVTYYRNGTLLKTVTVDPILSLKIKSAMKSGTTPRVFASFELRPTLQAVITPVAANGIGGSIAITASGGDAPYTYQWSTGATGATLSNQPAGTYTVTVTDAFGRAVTMPYDLGYPVRWSVLKNATETNGVLKKTAATAWNNGGAVSASYLAGSANGWISFVADTTSGAYILGFAAEDHQFNEQKVLHGIYITADNHLYITESGTSTLAGAKVAGDVFRIARAGNQVTYYRNGTVLKTTTVEPVLSLRIKASLYSGSSPRLLASFDVKPWLAATVTPLNAGGTGGAIAVTASQGDAPYTYQWSPGTAGQAITGQLMGVYAMTATDASGRTSTSTYDLGYRTTWKDLRNVNEVGGALVKTVTGAGWDNGAISTNRLYDLEDGWVSFVADTTAGAYAIGFATDTTDFSDAGIAQGIYITADNFVYVTEAGVNTLAGAKIPGDIFRIARIENHVNIYKNGTILKTATVDPSLILRIKSAIHSGSSPQVLTSIERPGSAADGYKVQWVDISGATDSRSILTKQGSPGRGNGAHSANLLAAGEDGWLEYEIFQTTSRYTIGFSTYAGPYQSYTANYSFSVGKGDTLSVYENDDESIAIATWQVGDKLRIARAGNQIIYYRNGQELRRISVDPATELRVRAVIDEGMSPAVFASFTTRIVVLAKTITPVKVNGTGGGISVQGLHGKAPYTYQWSSGETTDAISNKNAGVYTVTAEDVRGLAQTVPYTLGFKASWTDLTLVSNDNGTLKKMTGIEEDWNAGANSFNMLDAGQDGWIEFAIDTGASNYIIGFSGNSAGFEQERIDYGLSVIDGKKIAAYEKSAQGIPLSSWQPGDVLKIRRIGSTVKYYRNGVELRSVPTDPNNQYRVKATVYSGEVPPVFVSFDVPLILQASFTPLKSYGGTGGIVVIPVTGAGPFTYGWSGGETTQGITDKGLGTYSVNVADAEGRTASGTYDLGYKVVWQDVINASDTYGQLIKSTTDGSIAGANSVNVLKANQDGWLQFTVDNAASNVSIGFATYNAIFNTAAIDHGLTVKPGEPVMASESDWTGVSLGHWKLGDSYKIARIGNQVKYYKNGMAVRTVTTDPSKALVIKVALYEGRTSMMLTSIPVNDRVATPIDETTVTYTIPKAIRISRDGTTQAVEVPAPEPLTLNEINAGETRPLFPGCPSGYYYVGFQLEYDLGDRKTMDDWSAFVQVSMFHNEDSLWTRPLRVKMTDQTFLATAFYDTTISCDGDYVYRIDFKNLEGNVPKDNVRLKTLLYERRKDFDPNATPVIDTCPPADREREITWLHNSHGTIGYDVEWVFIEAHELHEDFTGANQYKAFDFKEPVRITTPNHKYKHQVYYPTGEIWYRVRAVGYDDPDFLNHRLTTAWAYSPCGPVAIINHQPDMNWQQQTVFAEEGKYKKVMNYFDGTMRQRQVQTNLSSEQVTLTGETLYDFEGRSAVNVLAVPATDNSLTYKPGFNVFAESTDSLIQKRTSGLQQKFHYDNYKLENSPMADISGAARYYSSNNTSGSSLNDYIPDAKGYVYAQTEYLNDGTGRVLRQSGVGEKFRTDTLHTTRYHYGEAAPEELARLFGSNVGKAEHYKKNAVIDANGQVSISYLDQEDRVIATALAGESPANVDSLASHKHEPVTINISAKNKKGNGLNVISHKIMNVKLNTPFTFNYDLTAYGSEIDGYGCNTCFFELRISLTDPEGKAIDLSEFSGSASDNLTPDYVLRNITAASCANPATNHVLLSNVLFREIGEYTITKTLTAYDRSFEEMNTVLRNNETIMARMEELRSTFVADTTGCALCNACPEAEAAINEAIKEIAEQDCENIYRVIEGDVRKQLETEYPDEEESEFFDSLAVIRIPNDARYCQYLLCRKDMASAMFEKKIARAPNWEVALDSGYTELLEKDPFFNVDTLSGHGLKAQMQTALNDVFVTSLNGIYYSGPIGAITDPANVSLYIDENGNEDPDNGRHILYLDLMGKRALGMINDSTYNAEISHARWALYRGFYMEEKRKMKLIAYDTCPAAKNDLEQQAEDVPVADNDSIAAWGQRHDVPVTATNEQLDGTMASMKFYCNADFSTADTTAIRANLRTYFNSNKNNFFRLILKSDVGVNPELIAIQQILNKYPGCKLDSIALDDPLMCVKDTTIVQYPPDEGGEGEVGFTAAAEPEMMAATALTDGVPDPAPADSLSVTEAKVPDAMEILEQLLGRDQEQQTVSSPVQATMMAMSMSAQDIVLTPAIEINALIDLYEATQQGGPWVSSTGWSTAQRGQAQSVQGWSPTVKVDGEGHVIELDFGLFNRLRGQLPESLGSLVYLQSLTIRGYNNYLSTDRNRLTGPLPASIVNLVNLTSLILSEHEISGGIPNGISNLSQLKILDLTSNSMSGAIPDEIADLAQLDSLDLARNGFTALTNRIGDLHNLKKLDLSVNRQLFNDAGGQIPVSLCDLENLTRLYMQYCGIVELPSVFGTDFPNLEKLYLDGNVFTSPLPDNFRGITASGPAMNSLLELSLTGCGLVKLPAHFGENLTALRKLVLYENKLGSLSDYFRGADASGNGMNNLAVLYLSLRLSNMNVYQGQEQQLTKLPANFGRNLPKLTMMQMDRCGIEELPDNFTGANLPALENLYVSWSNLQDLPEHFGQGMTALKELRLEWNNLESLPDNFHGTNASGDAMNSLKLLHLYENKLTELPDHFGENLITLEELKLQDNKLTALPDYFRGANASGNGMNGLKILILGDTTYIGLKETNVINHLPAHFGENWTSLQELTASGISLMDLPDYFRGTNATSDGMNSLKKLYLHYNMLGALPAHFGENWLSLEHLHLYGNLLTQLPDYFRGANATGNGMNNLQELYLSHGAHVLQATSWGVNNLTSLPPHFGENMTELRILDIHGNQLQNLPDYFRGVNAAGSGMTKLTNLKLYKNLLESLPTHFGENWTSLQELYLFDNKLKALPDYFHGANAAGNGMNGLMTLFLGFQQFNRSLNPNSQGRYSEASAFVDHGSNELENLPVHFGENWTSLATLRLEGNKLKQLPDYFHGANAAGNGMNTLSSLFLNDNMLTSLPDHFGENWTSLTTLYLYSNELAKLPDYFRGANASGNGMNNLRTLFLGNRVGNTNYGSNPLKSLPEHFGENWSFLDELHLEDNQLTSLTPYFKGETEAGPGMKAVTKLFLNNNSLGALPELFGTNMTHLGFLSLQNNNITELTLPVASLSGIVYLQLANNELTYFPNEWWQLNQLRHIDVSGNRISNRISDAIPTTVSYFNIRDNRLTFTDLLEVKRAFKGVPNNFDYASQQEVDDALTMRYKSGDLLELKANIDRNIQAELGLTYAECTFQWFREGNSNPMEGHTVTINPTEADNGARYYYKIKNAGASNLVLTSKFRTLELRQPKIYNVCLEYDTTNSTLKQFQVIVDWNKEVQKCIDSAKAEQIVLRELAVEKLIEQEMSTYYNQFRTNCDSLLTETLTYTYQNIEHHYTLYYYDQAGSLVQTVPPTGVDLVNQNHKLITNYRYNSLNQLTWQQTPDAGKSRFWYNEKGQLRLSQNAQQRMDNNYSYTRYDEQGRIVEVGEMNTTADTTALRVALEALSFPRAEEYTLTDITRTRYDFADPGLVAEAGFEQEFLRSRVASVEVIAKGSSDTVSTHYSYDIHGNVKSLLQRLPGLGFKRTDYVYDLVSGKVNYVMYQYDKADEFIHEYCYDADNRIKEVKTSTDGFIWDRDAAYSYYRHGPLEQQYVGHYDLQQLDYYYTLQGWIKGVNGIGYSPGKDVTLPPRADVFAYNLGYYRNDYKAKSDSVPSAAFHQPMQAYTSLMGNDGLYNGNIAWMATDLKKIGQQKGNLLLGTQAMLYRYDQLNRITQSRSVSPDTITGEFVRGIGQQAYDEDYSYDANGNLLTLQRLDYHAALKDNFTYGYYKNSNKLRYLEVKDTVYSDAITSNTKIYRNINIKETAHMQAGSDVVLKALENIDFEDPANFDAPDDATLHAYALPDDEGAFMYDAIGNLVWDVEEGVKISWTPYGKVREIVKDRDTTTVRFLYDGAGNRIEKQVIRPDRTTITRYVRDASGNVMAVYRDTAMIEQSIYGSSRLGIYQGGRIAGHRTLGSRNYEFSNHLGNVLTVISDNIYMNTDSAWTKVISASDYYPFGLAMEGRSYSDTTYRYGFNGKEKDDKGEWGDTHYDYGFRIYNPRIAKFLTTDPLTAKFAMLTPYQFASNSPIENIDMDGLEAISIHGTWSNKETWDKDFSQGMLRATNWEGIQKSMYLAQWSGSNTSEARIKAANDITNWILSDKNPLRDRKHTTLISHSHGGNVSKLVKNQLEKEGWLVDIVNIETPQRSDFQSDKKGDGVYLNFYSSKDLIQYLGNSDYAIPEKNEGPEGARIDPQAEANIELNTHRTLYRSEGKKTVLAPIIYGGEWVANVVEWIKEGAGHSLQQAERSKTQILKETEKAFNEKKDE